MMRRVEESINNGLVTKQGSDRDILAFAERQKRMTHPADTAVQQLTAS
jgi:hypothetical protein